jgi:hypothetical protein
MNKLDVPGGKVRLQCPYCGWQTEAMTQYEALSAPRHECPKVTEPTVETKSAGPQHS